MDGMWIPCFQTNPNEIQACKKDWPRFAHMIAQSASPNHACIVLLQISFVGPEHGQFMMLMILHHHCPSCFGWCNEPCHHLVRGCSSKATRTTLHSHDLWSLPVMVGTAQTWCAKTPWRWPSPNSFEEVSEVIGKWFILLLKPMVTWGSPALTHYNPSLDQTLTWQWTIFSMSNPLIATFSVNQTYLPLPGCFQRGGNVVNPLPWTTTI